MKLNPMRLNLKKIIASYGRVSTVEQDQNQFASEQQIARLKQLHPDVIYFDVETGGSTDREKLCILLDRIRAGEVEKIIATRLDRLTRNEELYLELKRLIKLHEVKLHLLDLGDVDLTTAAGELNLDIQCVLAVNERRQLRDRVLRGHSYRREREAPFGRAPWGYQIQHERFVKDKRPLICLLTQRPENYEELAQEPDDSRNLVVGISRADLVSELLDLLKQHKRPRVVLGVLRKKYGIPHKRQVAITRADRERRAQMFADVEYDQKKEKKVDLTTSEELLLWNAPHSVVEWVQNPVLRGHTVYNKYDKSKQQLPPEQWDIRYDTHPHQRYLSEEEFLELQAIFKANHRAVGTPGATFYLTKFIYCDCCGYPMVLKRGPQYQYYGCRHTSEHCGNRGCIRLEKLDQAIIQSTVERAMQFKVTATSDADIPPESPEILALREQIADLETTLQKRPNTVLKQAHQDLQKDLQRLINDAEHVVFVKATAEEILQFPHARNLAFWYSITRQERETIYEKLLHQVLVRYGEVVSVTLKV